MHSILSYPGNALAAAQCIVIGPVCFVGAWVLCVRSVINNNNIVYYKLLLLLWH